jgi:hypothetical protein
MPPLQQHSVRLAGMLAVLIVLQGCAGGHSIKIDSEPTGATVYASGRDIGSTPLTMVPDEVFPPRFVGGSYRATGDLKIERAGCKPFSQNVNDRALAKDISVKLECDPAALAAESRPAPAKPSMPTAVAPMAPAPSEGAAGRGADIKQRLQTLEDLRKDGLVTDQEYRTIRKRILDGL